MDTLRDRIDYIRKDCGLSYKNLAELVGGISGDGLRKAINRGSKKDEFYAKQIAIKTGYNQNWVLEGLGEKKPITMKEIPTEDSRLFLVKDGTRVHIDEIVDFMEGDYDFLIEKSLKYKFFMGDKTNTLMYKFFKEHGIQVKINNKEN